MSKRNTTVNADTISNAHEAGYRARQGALRAEQEHTRRRTNPGPRRVIPFWRALFNFACGVVLIVVMSNRLDKVPHIPPSMDTNQMKMDWDVEDARNGVYEHKGITPVSEEVRRAMRGPGIR